MPKQNLTDRLLKSLEKKPADKGKRYEIGDTVVPGLAIRVTDKGTRTFILVGRMPGDESVSRPMIGEYGVVTLEAARVKAREWLELMQRGINPKLHVIETRAKEIERQEHTFGRVVEDYLKRAVLGPDEKNPIMRTASGISRNLRSEFSEDYVRPDGSKRKGLSKRPISGITKRDILDVVDDAIDRGSPSMAHTLLAHVRMLFNWAIDSGKYDIEASPCDRIKPKAVIGKKPKRKRVLNDEEIAAVWEAADKLGYPYGQFYKLLFLTGLRRSEVAEMPRAELDIAAAMWTVPKERMKKENDHHVPLTPLALEIINTIPIFDDGDYCFSTTNGEKAINSWSKAKAAFDAEVLIALKRRAAVAGRDPGKVKLQPFVNHDIRRTVRTRLSSLGVSKVVAELIIAHTQKDLDAVYDQWAFINERRHALLLWEEKLRSIVEPKPDNVVPLRKKR